MGELPGDTRASLLLRLREHDDAAWTEFFKIYTPAVLGYALRRGLQKNDAEDIAQEVLVEVARGIRAFVYQPEKGRFRDWLGTIAWRRIAKHWNAKKRNEINSPEEFVEGQTDSEWIDEYHAAILQTAIENLQPRFAQQSWDAFLLVWKHGESAQDVAIKLNIPIEVVYNAKSRVLKQLELEVLRIADDCSWLRK